MLGAGGVLGGAWLVGGLSALARETDWDPGSADFVVGTSAGLDDRRARGRRHSALVHGRPLARRGLRGPGRAPTAARPPRPTAPPARASGSTAASRPSAPARSAWRSPRCRTRCGTRRSRWSPAGSRRASSRPTRSGTPSRRAVPGDWVDHPNYWAVACDYETGRRTPFGRLGSPRAHIGDAVAASCAIPGFYRPVKIGRRRYVDGGVCSVSNLDLRGGPRARPRDLPQPAHELAGGPALRRRRPRRGHGRDQRGDRLHPVAHPARLARPARARGAQGAPLRHRGGR